jgi:hypothetical protein
MDATAPPGKRTGPVLRAPIGLVEVTSGRSALSGRVYCPDCEDVGGCL